jgi:transposase
MYRNMNDWTEIRRRVLVEGVSRRQILRETGMHRQTLKKILEHSEPPGYRQQQPRPRKELGAFLERIKQILKDDQAMPRKQRHTAKRIWERLREDGFTGGYTVVKDAVREPGGRRTHRRARGKFREANRNEINLADPTDCGSCVKRI